MPDRFTDVVYRKMVKTNLQQRIFDTFNKIRARVNWLPMIFSSWTRVPEFNPRGKPDTIEDLTAVNSNSKTQAPGQAKFMIM